MNTFFVSICVGRRKRRLRQLRRQRQTEGFASTDNLSPSIFGDDLPPSYSEISHTNPIALCGMDEDPYQVRTGHQISHIRARIVSSVYC